METNLLTAPVLLDSRTFGSEERSTAVNAVARPARAARAARRALRARGLAPAAVPRLAGRRPPDRPAPIAFRRADRGAWRWCLPAAARRRVPSNLRSRRRRSRRRWRVRRPALPSLRARAALASREPIADVRQELARRPRRRRAAPRRAASPRALCVCPPIPWPRRRRNGAPRTTPRAVAGRGRTALRP